MVPANHLATQGTRALMGPHAIRWDNSLVTDISMRVTVADRSRLKMTDHRFSNRVALSRMIWSNLAQPTFNPYVAPFGNHTREPFDTSRVPCTEPSRFTRNFTSAFPSARCGMLNDTSCFATLYPLTCVGEQIHPARAQLLSTARRKRRLRDTSWLSSTLRDRCLLIIRCQIIW